MSKLILVFTIVLVLTLCAAGLFAAESEQQEVKNTYFGALLGLNFATFHGDNADAAEFYGGGEKKSRTGVAVGAFAHFGIGKIFAIEPQVLFSQKGAKYEYTEPGWTESLVVKLD